MDYLLSAEGKEICASVRKVVEREVLPLEENLDIDRPTSPELRNKVRQIGVKLGFYGMYMPEEMGGAGINNVTTCAIWETIAETGSWLGRYLIGGATGGPTAILMGCNEAQREKYLYPLMRAEKTQCFAITEPEAGSDATALRTTAVRDGDHWVLNGRKHFVSNGAHADFAIVFAVTDKEKRARGGITCFVVDKGTPGYSVGRFHKILGFDNQIHCELLFEDCRVPDENVIGEVGWGFRLAMAWINVGRLKVGAQGAGHIQWLIRLCADYANQRVTFGKPIARRQGIQWMLADMEVDRQSLRAITYNAAHKADLGQNIRMEASIVKLLGGQATFRCADRALQIHGGTGCDSEMPIEKFWRWCRIIRVAEGTDEIQKRTIARMLLEQ
jgi:acyl-CoA dehydrogenase